MCPARISISWVGVPRNRPRQIQATHYGFLVSRNVTRRPGITGHKLPNVITGTLRLTPPGITRRGTGMLSACRTRNYKGEGERGGACRGLCGGRASGLGGGSSDCQCRWQVGGVDRRAMTYLLGARLVLIDGLSNRRAGAASQLPVLVASWWSGPSRHDIPVGRAAGID